MLSSARRDSITSISAGTSIFAFGGARGGFSTMISVEAWALSPRESVQVTLTAIAPGGTPAVFSAAESPVPETVPPLAVQPATEAGTPSGLVHLADKFTLAPTGTLIALAKIDMVGRFLGGSGSRDRVGRFLGGGGFMVKLAEQLARLFSFSSASVTLAVTA